MEWYIFAIISAILSGIVPIIDKKILKTVSVIDFSSIYSISAFAWSLLLLYFIDITFNAKIVILIFIASIFGSLGFYTINKALKRYDISIVSPLRSFNPIVLLILATIFLGESITLANVAGIMLIVTGTYIIESRHVLHNPLKPIKHMVKSGLFLMIFASSIFYGISSLTDKIILSQYNVIGYIVLAHLFIMVNFIAINIFEHRKIFSWNKKTKSALLLISTVAAITVLYRLSLAQAVSMTLVALVIPIKHMDSLIATIVGGELFHEKHLKKKIFAAFIMFIGAVLVIL